MTTYKYNPSHAGRKFGSMVDDLFGRSISDLLGQDWAVNRPFANVSEADKNFLIEIAPPGLAKSDFEIKIEKDQIIISAKTENTSTETDSKFTRTEFNFS